MRLTFWIEQGEAGLFYVTCQEDAGFIATGKSVPSALVDAARAFMVLEKARAEPPGGGRE